MGVFRGRFLQEVRTRVAGTIKQRNDRKISLLIFQNEEALHEYYPAEIRNHRCDILDTMNTIIIIAIVVVIAGVFAWMAIASKKKKDSSWAGIVTDKNIEENIRGATGFNRQDNHTNNPGGLSFNLGTPTTNQQVVTHTYTVTVKTDSGEELKWDVSSGMYEQIAIGDRLTKPAGTMTPEITQKAAPAAPSEVSSLN